jgi:hypothetical protein
MKIIFLDIDGAVKMAIDILAKEDNPYGEM